MDTSARSRAVFAVGGPPTTLVRSQRIGSASGSVFFADGPGTYGSDVGVLRYDYGRPESGETRWRAEIASGWGYRRDAGVDACTGGGMRGQGVPRSWGQSWARAAPA